MVFDYNFGLHHIYDYRILSIHDGHTLLGAGALAQRAALSWKPHNRLECTEDRSMGRRSAWDTAVTPAGIEAARAGQWDFLGEAAS